MHAADLLSGWDTAILMAPFFGLLAFWMFGLDERVTAPREQSTRRRFCQTDVNGRSRFCDPDGRTAKMRHPITPPPPYAPGLREFLASEPAPKRTSTVDKILAI
jgi:hypothetical protein